MQKIQFHSAIVHSILTLAHSWCFCNFVWPRCIFTSEFIRIFPHPTRLAFRLLYSLLMQPRGWRQKQHLFANSSHSIAKKVFGHIIFAFSLTSTNGTSPYFFRGFFNILQLFWTIFSILRPFPHPILSYSFFSSSYFLNLIPITLPFYRTEKALKQHA